VQSASAALVAVRLVHRTTIFQLTLRFARVNARTVNTPLEESRTAFKIFLITKSIEI
jgi:hypothetical protein